MPNLSREDLLASALVDVAIESWRFLRVMERLTDGLDAEQQRRAVSRCAYFRKQLTDALEGVELRLVALEGSRYGPGLAASAVNADDFPSEDDLIVDQTIEPVVMGPAGVVRAGTVTLRRPIG